MHSYLKIPQALVLMTTLATALAFLVAVFTAMWSLGPSETPSPKYEKLSLQSLLDLQRSLRVEIKQRLGREIFRETSKIRDTRESLKNISSLLQQTAKKKEYDES